MHQRDIWRCVILLKLNKYDITLHVYSIYVLIYIVLCWREGVKNSVFSEICQKGMGNLSFSLRLRLRQGGEKEIWQFSEKTLSFFIPFLSLPSIRRELDTSLIHLWCSYLYYYFHEWYFLLQINMNMKWEIMKCGIMQGNAVFSFVKTGIVHLLRDLIVAPA